MSQSWLSVFTADAVLAGALQWLSDQSDYDVLGSVLAFASLARPVMKKVSQLPTPGYPEVVQGQFHPLQAVNMSCLTESTP